MARNLHNSFHDDVFQSLKPTVGKGFGALIGGLGCLWLLVVMAGLAVPILIVLALCRYLGWL
jgi:hypothetical protein